MLKRQNLSTHLNHRPTYHVLLNSLTFLCVCNILFKIKNFLLFNLSILDHNPQCDVPPIINDLITFLNKHGMNIEGIFRRSASVATIKILQSKINLG